jgi:hypothetical protein
LPRYVSNELTDYVNIPFKEKCELFCKKHSIYKLISDYAVNCKNSNTEPKLRPDTKFIDVKKIAQEKLNDFQFNELIKIHEQIRKSGTHNYLGCKIPVQSGINIQFFREKLVDYHDNIICEFLEFGAPVVYEGEFVGSEFITKNHKGATDFSKEIEKYLKKEASYGAIIGPFFKNPFCCDFKISPLNTHLNTVIKKDSVERRVILDLSYPVGNSINDGISQEYYLGKKINICYPNVDDFVDIIKLKGQGCLMFKKDLNRAYRQIPLCSGDMHLVGFQWEDAMFCRQSTSYGLKI